jgi:hypothetical protein
MNEVVDEYGLRDVPEVNGDQSPARSRLTLRKPSEFLAMQFDDSDIILGDRLFATGQSLVIAGVGGSGKSRILLQLAASVVAHRKFWAFNTGGAALRWLILQTENSNRRMKEDMGRLSVWLGDEWPSFDERVVIHAIENDLDGFVSLDSTENVSAIEDAIAETKPDIIAIDPLTDFAIGDLNKDADMRATLLALSRVFRKGNPRRAIVVLHHAITGRAGAAKATGYDRASFGRNSKALHAWTRGQINLAPADPDNNDRLIVSCGKSSNGREFLPFAIRLNPDTMIYECDPTVDVKAWATAISQPTQKHNRKATVEEFISIFRSDTNNPRACLISGTELKESFRTHGWDEQQAAALRDECEGNGKVEVFHGPHNQKLAGLPAMVQAFRKQKAEAGTILEQVPLTPKPKRKKCKKR